MAKTRSENGSSLQFASLLIFFTAVKVGLPYMLGQLTVVPYDDGTFKFGAGVARDGCAIWQDAGVVAAALLLIFAINFKSHQNELDKT
ncbi:hypothetical protein GLP43_03215 [Sulfitobacter sp. M39]|uniref:hypothetical protein n=1 Tax=Sulfitobacter sp. M39 TaxID=2675334 RepID=UPI001F1EF78B|nr:hypothetical protein [Sulfitobacter sp. M39]MCF7746575.1 hypothetical protein [Sulfitobacter sp. M39]